MTSSRLIDALDARFASFPFVFFLVSDLVGMSMWTILRKVGATYGFYQEALPSSDTHLLQLDAVTVTGCLDTAGLKEVSEKRGIRFSSEALDIVTNVSKFKERTLRETFPISQCGHNVMVTTPPRWENHFMQLMAFGLLRRAAIGTCMLFATYFAVAKSDGTGRSIFNGKKLSKTFFAPPPPVCLPDLAELLKVISAAFSDCRRLFLLTGDWRHWFHQIAFNPEIAPFFSLSMKTKERGRECFHWTSIPMGWSWSPFLAQAIGYLLIIVALAEIGLEVTASIRNSSSPPPYILLRSAGSTIFICLWYDNVLFITDDGDLSKRFFSKFSVVCRRFRAVFKHWTEFRGSHLLTRNIPNIPSAGASPLPLYLGLQFALSSKRNRDQPGSVTLTWRPDPEKKARWLSAIEEGEMAAGSKLGVSPRAVLQIIGRVMWFHHISLRPLLEISDVIEKTRVCATVAAAHGWRTPLHMLGSHMRETCLIARSLMSTFDNWIQHRPIETKGLIHAASDSSKPLGGYCFWSSTRDLIEMRTIIWNADMLPSHIFLKELLAATLAIECLCQRYRETLIILCIDNSAAAWCLRRLFSSTVNGLEMVTRVHRALTSAGNVLRTIQVGSLDNPADIPTRKGKRKNELEERTARMFAIIDGERSKTVVRSMSTADVRHEELEKDDGFDSDESMNEEDPNEEMWDSLSEDDEVAPVERLE